MTACTRARARPYKVLGDDVDDWPQEPHGQHDLGQGQQQELPAVAQPTVESCSSEMFPADVWEAAKACSDHGTAVLQAFLEIQTVREGYCTWLAQLAHSQPSCTLHPLLHSGKQLFDHQHHRTTALSALVKTPPTATAGTVQSGYTRGLRDLHGPCVAQNLFTGTSNLTQAVKSTSDHRKLHLFDEQQQIWGRVQGQLAERTLRPTQDLAMNRGQEYRHHLELLETLQRAMPLEDRSAGTELWNMSLRNAWERVVPLGSLFSGLTVTLRETPPLADHRGRKGPGDRHTQHTTQHQLLRVGRPLDPPTLPPLQPPASRSAFDTTPMLGRSLVRRGRDWASGSVLRARLDQYAEAINRQFPHRPDMPSLQVTGQSLAAALEASLRTQITLADIVPHLETAHPAVCQEVKALLAQHTRPETTAQPDTLTAAAAGDGTCQGDRQQQLLPGIHVECQPQSVLLSCALGHEDLRTVSLTNTGTVSVQYRWVRTPGAAHRAATDQQHCAHSPPPIHVHQQEGVLLPGDTLETTLVFKPTTAGVFAEQWCLTTVPDWPSTAPPLTLPVRAAATRSTQGAPKQQALGAELSGQEKMAKVYAALEHILACAGPQAPVSATESQQEEWACQVWDAANAGVWPPLYYPGEQRVGELRELYTTTRTALLAALRPIEAPAAKGKQPPAKGKPTVDIDTPVVLWPEVWSQSVHDLKCLVTELHTAEAAAQQRSSEMAVADPVAPTVTPPGPPASQLHKQLDCLLASQAFRVPRDGRVLIRHAARSALCQTLDAVGEKLASVRDDFDQRVKEAAVSAQAAAGTGRAASLVPPSQQWLADKMKAGAKAQLKSLVGGWWEEVAREKSAVANWMESALLSLDQAAPAAAQASAPTDTQEYYWARFALLREWVRLGLPSRQTVQ